MQTTPADPKILQKRPKIRSRTGLQHAGEMACLFAAIPAEKPHEKLRNANMTSQHRIMKNICFPKEKRTFLMFGRVQLLAEMTNKAQQHTVKKTCCWRVQKPANSLKKLYKIVPASDHAKKNSARDAFGFDFGRISPLSWPQVQPKTRPEWARERHLSPFL